MILQEPQAEYLIDCNPPPIILFYIQKCFKIMSVNQHSFSNIKLCDGKVD
jgi:hypothetical protein